MSGVITRRLETVINKVIGRQQKAYSRVKNMGSVLINLLNTINYANKRKLESLILSINFHKAFDSIDHRYMNIMLEILNFGPEFQKWVNLFFNDRWTYIILQGFLSNKITLKQGVPQGDFSGTLLEGDVHLVLGVQGTTLLSSILLFYRFVTRNFSDSNDESKTSSF